MITTTRLTRSGWCAGSIACLALLTPNISEACAPAAPPYWPALIQKGSPPIAIGRVLSVTPLSKSEVGVRFELSQAAVLIERVEPVQGEVPIVTVFTAPISVRLREGQPALDGWCGRMMDLRVGEIVLVLGSGPIDVGCAI